MKILYDNYLDDSTVTTDSEDSLYPVTNLTHNFLLKKYMALGQNAQITVTFPEDRTVSCIAYGYNNAVTSTDEIVITQGAIDEFFITQGATDEVFITLQAVYELKNSSGTVVASGTMQVGEDVNMFYIDPTVCRSIELTFASEDTLYIGGLSVGDPLEFQYLQINPRMTRIPREKPSLTDGGQLIGSRVRPLKRWQIVAMYQTNAKRKELETMIDTVGYFKTFYADLYDGATGIEDPMFCSFIDIGNNRRESNSQTYTLPMTLEEKR